MMTVRETGLYDKSIQTGVSLAYELFAFKDFDLNFIKNQELMVLDELKIALGPYLCGIAIAVISLLIEITCYFSTVYSLSIIIKYFLY